MFAAALGALFAAAALAAAWQLDRPPMVSPVVKLKLSTLDIFSTMRVINADVQFHGHVTPDKNESYMYLHGAFGPLTIIISPCTAGVNVTVYHVAHNTTGFLKDYMRDRGVPALASGRGRPGAPLVLSWPARSAGLYVLDLSASGGVPTGVAVFAVCQPAAPAVLRIPPRPRLRLQPRLHRNRFTLRWDQSAVDPQALNYCVAVNSRRNFTSLCEAHAAPGMRVHSARVPPTRERGRAATALSDRPARLGVDDVFVTCVDSGLSYTISDLQRGRDYYFNVFAVNKKTNLSFLYGSKSLRYDPKLQPIGLRDIKPVTVNIRKLGGKALFRYKVGYESAALTWVVMPCGGAVQAEVSVRRHVVVPRQLVQGYRLLQVPNPKPGQRYTLRLTVPNAEHLRQTLGVEVLATTKESPLPQLPAETSVFEYESMRRCHSTTVGWVPVAGESVRYCVAATPVPFADYEGHFRTTPNQCDLERRLSTQLDFATRYCQDFSANESRNVLTYTITKLRPGKEYLVQVTVKKIKGKALSYDLIRVRTKADC